MALNKPTPLFILFLVLLTVFKFNSAEMVDAHLGKKYKLQSSENFDEFMKALGEIFVFLFFKFALNSKSHRPVQGLKTCLKL